MKRAIKSIFVILVALMLSSQAKALSYKIPGVHIVRNYGDGVVGHTCVSNNYDCAVVDMLMNKITFINKNPITLPGMYIIPTENGTEVDLQKVIDDLHSKTGMLLNSTGDEIEE